VTRSTSRLVDARQGNRITACWNPASYDIQYHRHAPSCRPARLQKITQITQFIKSRLLACAAQFCGVVLIPKSKCCRVPRIQSRNSRKNKNFAEPCLSFQNGGSSRFALLEMPRYFLTMKSSSKASRLEREKIRSRNIL
jgi:hypothetical protein